MFRRGTTKKKASTGTWTAASSQSTNATNGKAPKSAIALTDYAERCRSLLDIQRELMAISVSLRIDLPRVVVIGGQSSGKSSLVEAVSGITVPRDSGVCTRCPMICNLSSATDRWYCTIELCKQYDDSGANIGNTSDAHDFAGVIHDKTKVELWIRRAQAAILSPHRDPTEFMSMTKADLKANADNDPRIKEFSRNSVRVNVFDPDSTDISFVDLPGLIQNADRGLIDLVHDLVQSHIRSKNTIIVMAMPMSDDIEMIEAVTLAKAADSGRERTIGVLTKPDAITQGAKGGREKWKAVLEGREHATQHGYFCVKLLDEEDRERHVTAHDAQKMATHFFETTDPWKAMDDRSRFGVPNFVAYISELLVGLLERNLRGIQKTVDEALKKCLCDIAALPPKLTNDPSTEIMARINSFCRDLQATTRGDQNKYFVQQNKARYAEFKGDIEGTTPKFCPSEDVNDYHPRLASFEFDSAMAPRALPCIREVIGKVITWELFGVPFKAVEVLLREYTQLWSEPTRRCFDDTFQNFQLFVHHLICTHFEPYEALIQYLSATIFEEVNKSHDEATAVIDKVLAFEVAPLYTQNSEALAEEKRRWYQAYSDDHIGGQALRSPVNLHYTFPNGRPNLAIATAQTWGITDELDVMASVQAYFQVAHKRLVDNVPLTIEHELHQTFVNRIEKTLLTQFFRDVAEGDVDVQSLVRESAKLEAERKALDMREACLRRIKEKIDLLVPPDATDAVSTMESVFAGPAATNELVNHYLLSE